MPIDLIFVKSIHVASLPIWNVVRFWLYIANADAPIVSIPLGKITDFALPCPEGRRSAQDIKLSGIAVI